jgi:magnesium chelatase family protein
VPAVASRDIDSGGGETSAVVRARVEAARARQRGRLAGIASSGRGIESNAEIPSNRLRELCPLDSDSRRLLAKVVGEGGISARSLDRIRRVARTIADLAGDDMRAEHVQEAVTFRILDK